MTKRMLSMIALAVLPGSALFGQNITGDWQGILKAGAQELRTVYRISVQDDKFKAALYSIDQGGQAISSTAFTKDGSIIKVAFSRINGKFEGKLSADGNSIVGTWTQGEPLPLTLVRATPATAWAIPEPLPPPKIMDAKATPTFEVATIKPAKPEEHFSLLVNRSGMLNTTATSVSDLIKFAYNLHPRQIIGGPAWLETEKYDVTGKPDLEGIPNVKQLAGMVQKLLEERFQLKFHREKKELSVYAITVTKSGAKITKDEDNPNGLPGFGGPPRRGFNVRNSTIAEFASILQANIVDRPVVDQTGFGTTRYDFVLKWTPDASQPQMGGAPNAAPAAEDLDAPPDLFTAFQQQLGLKLEPTKAPVDGLVIDKVEKPSAN